jgi:hypothetical protein
LKTKATLFGYGLFEAINKIVNTKDLILQTSDKIPFTENACCNENNDPDSVKPIKYFMKEDENLKIYIHSVVKIGGILKYANDLSRPSILYHPGITGIEYPEIPNNTSVENIFSTFIKYCNFDRELPIPEMFKAVCDERPPEYKASWSLVEKIEFLKKNGKNFTEANLKQLMAIVYKNNVVSVSKSLEFTRLDVFKDIIESLDRDDSTVVDALLREHLHNVIRNLRPKSLMNKSVQNAPLEKLEAHIYSINQGLLERIMDFFRRYGKLSTLEINKIEKFLLNISD